MAYKIQYSPESTMRYPNHIKKRKRNIGGLLTAFILIVAVIWVRVNGVPNFLIPGDPAVTKQAAQTFLTLIQEGEPVKDAVTVFCKEILDGAQV